MVQNLQQVDTATFDKWVAEQPEDQHYELINGEVFEKDMVTKPKHGHAATKLCGYLTVHLDTHNIDGYVTGESTGYQIGDQRYIPDGALVLGQPMDDAAYSTNHPTLMIEVISNPENTNERSTLDDKREVYLAANMTLWEANTQKRYVDVFTPDGRYQRVRDTLTLDDLPGLAIPLKRVFRQPAVE